MMASMLNCPDALYLLSTWLRIRRTWLLVTLADKSVVNQRISGEDELMDEWVETDSTYMMCMMCRMCVENA